MNVLQQHLLKVLSDMPKIEKVNEMPCYVYYFFKFCEGSMTMNESYILYLNSCFDIFHFYVCCIAHTCLSCLPNALTPKLAPMVVVLSVCQVCYLHHVPVDCPACPHIHFSTSIKFALDPWDFQS